MKQREKFRCLRCGECCMMRIKISEEDIKNIESKGYADFIYKDVEGEKFVKMVNGFCYFLVLDKGITSCKVYDARPDGCRDYPFFDDRVMECSAVNQKL